ncbi:hypothetical protein Ciccas_013951 [Cichlidogyrus casuarinus]|uniref:Uncharacterized protein n=1 Tax=Cichlidogyrus casuarinus TaxID=1844966 RepID=A0ABD2PJ96_9PLAT
MNNSQMKLLDGWTMLHYAASSGFDEIVRVFLHFKADMFVTDKKNWNPLHYAIIEGHLNVVRTYVHHDRGSLHHVENTGDTCLHLACTRNNTDIFDLICNEDVSLIDKCNRLNQSPLHSAAIHNCHDIAHQLIERGANLNPCDEKGQTPLFLAVKNNSTATIQILLQENAMIDNHSLFITVEKNDLDALKILLRHMEGFQTLVNKRDDMGCTILHIAAQNGHRRVVKALLKEHPELLGKHDDARNTALHTAAEAGHVSVVKCLLMEKIEFNARNRSKKSALDLAALNGHLAIVQILVSKTEMTYESEVEISDMLNTALQSACESNQAKIVRFLLKKNADPSYIKDGTDYNALDLALDNDARYFT